MGFREGRWVPPEQTWEERVRILRFRFGVVVAPLWGLLVLTAAIPASAQNALDGPYGVAVDSTSLYISNTGNNRVIKVPKAGGAAITLVSGLSGISPAGLAVDTLGNLYIADSGHGRVMKVPVGGGTPTTVISSLMQPLRVAVDSTSVYVSESIGNVVLKVPVGGGTPVVLMSGLNFPAGVAVDPFSVYVSNSLGNAVLKVPVGGGTRLR